MSGTLPHLFAAVTMASPFDEGEATLGRIAHRHGFSSEAARLMRAALEQGHGAMAHFDHPEFGGFGQWTRDGMVMLSGVPDGMLESRIDALCAELADLAEIPTLERAHGLPRER